MNKELIKNTLIYKTLKSLKNRGLKATLAKIKEKLVPLGLKFTNLKPKPKPIVVDNMDAIIKQVESNYLEVPSSQPLVSIIILTRNGLEHLQRLFKAIYDNTLYKNFEIIVVDNASKDKSLEFLENNRYNFNLEVIKNEQNESFSYANNQAAKISKGEYLLFLNNDTQPLKGWLSHLVATLQSSPKIAATGSLLLYPYMKNDPFSSKVQHAGIAFDYENQEDLKLQFFRPYNIGQGKTPIIANHKLNSGQRIALTAACMLVKKDIFNEVNGFDEQYSYGYEDVDLGLKFHQKGYKCLYCQNSIAFHYESSTQKKEYESVLTKRRESNIKHLHAKWHSYLMQHYFFEKFRGTQKLFSDRKLKIAFAVTEAGPEVSAGDYFTALELANAFKAMGYEVSFLQRRRADWYKVPTDIDVIVSMLDSYDLTKIKNKNKNFITIAWIRNWLDRWLDNPSFNDYSMIFASSQTLCAMVKEKSGREAILFPIATTPDKFIKANNQDKSFSSDYSFTGNYWGVPREIEGFLDPSELDYKFNIYGRDWDQVAKFAPYHQGFLNYQDIPKVYANSKITIDDAVVGITKPYGSVNSRVFDAIAGGTLVFTNGIIGAKETFGGLLPTYESKEELHTLLQEYLSDNSKRQKHIEKLQEFVVNHHTYRIRAQLMKQKLEAFVGMKPSVAIKMPIPNWSEAKNWGDYHLALGLQKQFKKLGYHTILQVLPEWNNYEGDRCDVVLVLRGLSQYEPKKHQLNLMWNISHPDKVSDEEYNSYDKVFVASDIWAKKLEERLTTQVEVMHQCSDPDLFKPFKSDEYKHQLLFVGNSRKIYRKALEYLLPTNYQLAVYGTLWEGIIDPQYLKGEHISNHEVHKYYSSADIVLNDHWDSMRENGFISNRIFDVLACNGFILTDNVGGLEELFGTSLITYNSKEDLQSKIEYYLKHKEEREQLSQMGRNLVLEKHSHRNRVEQIIKTIKRKLENEK